MVCATDAGIRKRAARYAALAAGGVALGLGVWARVSAFPSVLAGGSVLPLTADSNYHLHRSLRAHAEFPTVPVFDPLMNWPHGADCHWANGFDFASALLARLFAGPDDVLAAATVIAAVPVLFGVACALLGVRAAQLLFVSGPGAALAPLLALWLGALLPIAILESLLGRTDHHVAEAASVAALLLWLLARFPSVDFAGRSARGAFGFELAGGALIAAAMYLFNGSLLYAAALVPVLAWAALIDDRPRQPFARALAGSGAPAFALGALGTAALYAPNLRAHGQLVSYAFPSLLQPALLLLAALGCASAQLAAHAVPRGARALPLGRLAGLLAGLLLVCGSALLVAPLRQAVLAALSEHMLRADPWIAQIVEFQPLLRWSTLHDADGWREVLHHFGAFGPASVLALPFTVALARRAQPERAAAFAFCALWLLALALLQQRFTRVLVPLLAVWSAVAIAGLAGLLAARARTGPGRALAWLLAPALVLCGLLGSDTVRGRLAYRAEPPGSPQQASLFLARHNPPRADGSRAGVLTSWSLGHHMVWPAQSGVVANGFLFHIGREGLEQVQAALNGGEARALALMAERDLGWVVIGASYYVMARVGADRTHAVVLAPSGLGVVNAGFLSQVPLAVTMIGGGGIPEAGVPHLTQLAPRWASPQQLPNMAFALPELWAFERVRGAVLAGFATPGSLVRAEVELWTHGGQLPYAAAARAGPDGRFALRVPLWNGQLGATVKTGPRFIVHVPGHGAAEVSVSEADVRAGRTLELEPAAAH